MKPASHPYEISPPMKPGELEQLVDRQALDDGTAARLEIEIRAMATAVLYGADPAMPMGGRTWSAESRHSYLFDMQRWTIAWSPEQHLRDRMEPAVPYYNLTVFHPETGREPEDRMIIEAQLRHQIKVTSAH